MDQGGTLVDAGELRRLRDKRIIDVQGRSHARRSARDMHKPYII
jgi:hypothetical protein